jgi:hypothetical protein
MKKILFALVCVFVLTGCLSFEQEPELLPSVDFDEDGTAVFTWMQSSGGIFHMHYRTWDGSFSEIRGVVNDSDLPEYVKDNFTLDTTDVPVLYKYITGLGVKRFIQSLPFLHKHSSFNNSFTFLWNGESFESMYAFKVGE